MAMPEASVQPVYALVGSDAFLQDAYRQEIIQTVLGEADPQMAMTSHDATAELAAVLDDLRTLPFLAPRRLVIVRDADAFISAHRDALEAYLDNPAEAGTLVLMVSSFPKNTRLAKKVAKIGTIYDCSSPDETDLAAWVQRNASKRNKKIARPGAQLLLEWIGNDLAALDQEIEKLSLYVDQRGEITAEDVATLVTASAGAEAFALPNALTEGNAAQALTILAQMLSARGEEFRTLGMIRWHLVRAIRAKQLIAAGQTPAAALKAVKVFYRQAPAFEALLKRRSLDKLCGDFRRALAADRAMKSGTTAEVALQQLVVSLCQ
jgi:DNA polymerase-3 subunit delta